MARHFVRGILENILGENFITGCNNNSNIVHLCNPLSNFFVPTNAIRENLNFLPNQTFQIVPNLK